MPDALPLPDDLIELQRRRLAAWATLGDYTHEVETRRRAAYPLPEQVVERCTWTAEETARYDELRAVHDELMWQVRRHPTIVQALAERCWPQTWDALQVAARDAARA